LKEIVEASWFKRIIMTLIIINAATLGAETYPAVMSEYGAALRLIDRAILWIFVLELVMRVAAYGRRFFCDPWSLFDVAVIAIAFAPSNQAFSVLRAARILRALRLVSAFPRLRRVVEGLFSAIPGLGSVGAVLVIVFYVFAVMGTKLFGESHPEWFGALHASMFTLFQIMTLEGWPDIVREIKATHPNAWAFFVLYILVATFIALNLVIAVIVDAMQRQHAADADDERAAALRIEAEIKALHAKIDALAAPAVTR
jgi:voltage-gated sodium channel